MKVNERRTVVGGVDWPLCVPPNRGERSTRMPPWDGKPSITAFGLSSNKWTTAASSGGSEAQADRLCPKVGGRPALVLHSSNEPGELLQWPCTATMTAS